MNEKKNQCLMFRVTVLEIELTFNTHLTLNLTIYSGQGHKNAIVSSVQSLSLCGVGKNTANGF